jgi:lipopolysaccharide heptosyltransferase II
MSDLSPDGPSASERWRQASNILCVRLDYLGDVLMCTPAMRALKESAPGRSLTLLTSPGGTAAAPFIPEVDAAIAYAAPWMKSSAPHAADIDLAFIDSLRARRFDAAVIFTTYSQSALPAAMLCHLAGIPLRLAHCRENPYRMLSDWLPDPEPHQRIRHETRRQLDLVAAVGCVTPDERLSFRVPEDDMRKAGARLSSLGIEAGRPWVLMHPGATAASRRYPVRHWQAVLAQVTGEFDCPVVITGGAEEAALADEVAAGNPRAFSLAGQLSLGELGGVISLAPVMISNNTGPAHLAAALGTPVVDLYALTNPQHTPWQVPSRVLFHDVECRFCYKSVCPLGHSACLEQVRPEQVTAAARELMQARSCDSATDETPLRLFMRGRDG